MLTNIAIEQTFKKGEIIQDSNNFQNINIVKQGIIMLHIDNKKKILKPKNYFGYQ